MREIKFRGKVQGDWWYVNPDQFFRWRHFWLDVDRKTVGEYSSITDKRGIEIYEGDICLLLNKVTGTFYTTPYEVYFSKGDWGARDAHGNPYDNGEYRWSIVDWEGCEIIGNIYDNPELLNRYA